VAATTASRIVGGTPPTENDSPEAAT